MTDFRKKLILDAGEKQIDDIYQSFKNESGYLDNIIPQKGIFGIKNKNAVIWSELLYLEVTVAYRAFMQFELLYQSYSGSSSKETLQIIDKILLASIERGVTSRHKQSSLINIQEFNFLMKNRQTYLYGPVIAEWQEILKSNGPATTLKPNIFRCSGKLFLYLFSLLEISKENGWKNSLNDTAISSFQPETIKHSEAISRIEANWFTSISCVLKGIVSSIQ